MNDTTRENGVDLRLRTQAEVAAFFNVHRRDCLRLGFNWDAGETQELFTSCNLPMDRNTTPKRELVRTLPAANT